MELFKSKVFTECKESSSYYFGPHSLPVAACGIADIFRRGGGKHVDDCREVIEYKDLEFRTVETRLSPAQRANGIERKAFLEMKYTMSRSRLRTDGVWEASWGKWADSTTAWYSIGNFTKENGKWIIEPGDFLSLGSPVVPGVDLPVTMPNALGPFSRALPGEGTRILDGIAKEKPSSCIALFPPPLPGPVAPGHSITDTYSRTVQIARENASKGIRDSVCWDGPERMPHSNCPSTHFVGLRVCYGLDKTGQCERTSESVYLPGDVAFVEAVDWETFAHPSVCRSGNRLYEVQLKDAPPPDGRKRFIECMTAAMLASARKRLLDRGVPPEAQAAPEPAGGQGVEGSSPPVHSLRDNYARTVEIIKENEGRGMPDKLHTTDFPTAYVCYSITPTGQCQRTGELVMVPGDLAAPLDWAVVMRPGYCANRIAVGEEVVLKNPARNDGRKRFLRCSDAYRLGRTYNYLVQLGVKQ